MKCNKSSIKGVYKRQSSCNVSAINILPAIGRILMKFCFT